MVKLVVVAFGGIFMSAALYISFVVDKYFKEVVNKYPIDDTIQRADFGLNIYNFVSKFGYNAHLHQVTTEDGYILGVHHLRRKSLENTNANGSKPAILLIHCLLGSSFFYVNREKSLGLMLAENDWDVWLGNNRGNTYSRKHLTLDPDKDAKFWDFSFEECGVFDLPVMIDYVRNQTGQDKIFVIGFSQGNTEFYSMVDARPEYNDKVELFVALGPAAYLTHLNMPGLLLGAKITPFLKLAGDLLGIHEYFPHGRIITSLGTFFCGADSPVIEICRAGGYYLLGFEPSLHEKNMIPYLLEHFPAGNSLKMFLHYSQLVGSERFKKFDYGPKENILRYNSIEPPSFNLSSLTAPIALVYSFNDTITTIEDVERLASELPNVVKKLIVNSPLRHMDFMWCKDIDKVYISDLLYYLDSYIATHHHNTTTNLTNSN